jgi:hypothetical protein
MGDGEPAYDDGGGVSGQQQHRRRSLLRPGLRRRFLLQRVEQHGSCLEAPLPPPPVTELRSWVLCVRELAGRDRAPWRVYQAVGAMYTGNGEDCDIGVVALLVCEADGYIYIIIIIYGTRIYIYFYIFVYVDHDIKLPLDLL